MRTMKLLLLLSIPMLVGVAQASGQQKAYFCTATKPVNTPGASFNLTYYSKVFLAGSKPAKYALDFHHFVTEQYGVPFDERFGNGGCVPFDSPSEAQARLDNNIRIERSNARIFHRDASEVEIETGWSYSGNEESAETTSGEGPSEAEALHIARSSAVQKKSTPVSQWDEPTCSEGTKPTSAYDQTPVPNWTCTQPYKSNFPSALLAGSELGQGLTKAAALANAHSLATHRQKGIIKTWGTPVYSKVMRAKSQYDASLHPLYLCSVGYLYAPQ